MPMLLSSSVRRFIGAGACIPEPSGVLCSGRLRASETLGLELRATVLPLGVRWAPSERSFSAMLVRTREVCEVGDDGTKKS